MPKPINILVYGKDVRLLETRQMVLQSSGYKVTSTFDLSQIDEATAPDGFDLLLLCHTLSMEECGRALALAHSRWPRVQSLILTAGGSRSPIRLRDQVFDAMDGPAKLVSRVSKMFGAEGAMYAQAC